MKGNSLTFIYKYMYATSFENLDCLFPIQIYKTIEINVYTPSTKVN